MFQFTQNETTASRRRIFFYAVSASDGFTAVTTGLSTSTSVYIVKNGVTPGTTPVSPTFTHIDSGLWYYEMTAANLDSVGVLNVRISDALIRTVQLVGYVYSGDPLQVTTIPTFPANFSSLAITAGGIVSANTVQWNSVGVTGMPMPTYTQPGGFLATAFPAGTVASTTNITAGSVTTVTGNVNGNVTGNVTGSVGTLTATAVQNIWDDLTVNNTVTGSVGKLLVDNLNATVSSRSTLTAANVWDALTSGFVTVGSVGKLLADNVNATISSRSTLTAANVWDALTSGFVTVGSIGKLIVDNLNATITSRMASFTYTAPLDATGTANAVWNALVSTYDGTTSNATGSFGKALLRSDQSSKNGDTTMYSISGTNGIDVDIHRIDNDATAAINLKTLLMNTGTITLGGQFDTTGNTAITKSVWNQLRSTASPTSGVPAAGTFGYYLDQQVSTVSGGGGITAADVWTYGGGRSLTDKAGFSLATAQSYNNTGSVGSVTGSVGSVTGSVTVGTISADAVNATALSADACAEIADAILNRNIATGSSTGRTVKDVMKLLRNKVTVSATTLTVYEADGTSIAWTAAVTSDIAAIPITGVTP